MKKRILMMLMLLTVLVLGCACTVCAKTKKQPLNVTSIKTGLRVSNDKFSMILPKAAWNTKNFTIKKSEGNVKNSIRYSFYNNDNKKKYGGLVFSIMQTTKKEWLGDNQKTLAKVGKTYYVFYGPTDVEFGLDNSLRKSYENMSESCKKIQESFIVKKAYVNDKLGFYIDMPAELFRVVKAGKIKTSYDSVMKTNVKSVSFTGTIKGTKLGMFSIFRADKKYTEKALEEVSPFAHFIKTKGNHTYYLIATEELPAHQQAAFSKLMNSYVLKLASKVK